jgi:cell division protein FtsB
MIKELNLYTRVLLISFPILFMVGNASSAVLDEVQQVGEKKMDEAVKSQKKIDKIVAGAQERLIQYRSLLKQIEGLEAYNEQLSTQVAGQLNLIARFDASISQVALIERQMAPLVARIIWLQRILMWRRIFAR